MKKIALICVYFGKLPKWIRLYVETCRWNPTVDWLIFSDRAYSGPEAGNVRWVRLSREAFGALAGKRLNAEISVRDPRKVNDFKPMFGSIFGAYLPGYDFWGHVDLDVLWGNIRAFMTDELLERYQIISPQIRYLAGHCTFYRNRPEINGLYRDNPLHRDVLEDMGRYYGFEEKVLTKTVIQAAKEGRLNFLARPFALNANIGGDFFEDVPADEIREIKKGGAVWEKGRLFHAASGEERMNCHFDDWKKDWCFLFDLKPRGAVERIEMRKSGLRIYGPSRFKNALYFMEYGAGRLLRPLKVFMRHQAFPQARIEKGAEPRYEDYSARNGGDLKYDAMLKWTVTSVCNLQCDYCVNREKKGPFLKSAGRHFEKILRGGVPAAVEIIRTKLAKKRAAMRKDLPIDTVRLKRFLDKTDRIFVICLTGGEPFLLPNIREVSEAITERHYLALDTNLTSVQVPDFIRKIDPARVAWINASCQIDELEQNGLTERYIENYRLFQNNGFNVQASAVAYPAWLDRADEYRGYFKSRGVDLFFIRFYGLYRDKIYPGAYTPEELRVFGIENAEDVCGYRSGGRRCNAGYNVGVASNAGDVSPCYGISEIIGNLYEDIRFRENMISCPNEVCGCPLDIYVPALWRRAAGEVAGRR